MTLADLTILGETLPTRWVVAMIVILALLVFEIRAWFRMSRNRRRHHY